MTSLPDLILPKREFFGLSIDRVALRGVELNRHGTVTAVAETQLTKDLFGHGGIPDAELFKQAVISLREKGKFTTPYVVISFPEAFAYTRELILPHVSLEEVAEGVRWHVKELFPFPEEELYVDWKVVREEEHEFILSVVAVPKKSIDPLVNVIVSLGLKPLRLKPDASSVARILSLPVKEHAVVAEVNRTGASVTLVEGEKSVFTTVIPLNSQDTPVVYLDNVKRTIQEIIQYYSQKKLLDQKETIRTIVTGEVASDHWVKELPQPTHLLVTPMQNPAFNKAYASAMSQVSPPKDHETINLLPPHLQKVYDLERKNAFYQAVLVRTMSLIGAFTVLSGLVLGLLFVEQQQIDAEVKQLTNNVQSEGSNGQKLLAVNGTAKQIVALAPLRKTPRQQFIDFLSLVPTDIRVSQWEYDDSKQQFSVSAVALTRDSVINLRTILEDSEKFTKVTLPLSFLESQKDIPFSFTFIAK
jgi:hypothetical protein